MVVCSCQSVNITTAVIDYHEFWKHWFWNTMNIIDYLCLMLFYFPEFNRVHIHQVSISRISTNTVLRKSTLGRPCEALFVTSSWKSLRRMWTVMPFQTMSLNGWKSKVPENNSCDEEHFCGRRSVGFLTCWELGTIFLRHDTDRLCCAALPELVRPR